MAFENGFDPKKHFEPIIQSFQKDPSLMQDILSILDDFNKLDNLRCSTDNIFKKIKDRINNNWVYSCLIQFINYDENKADEIWGERIPKLMELPIDIKYKNFFVSINKIFKSILFNNDK